MFEPNYRITDYYLLLISKISTYSAKIDQTRIRLPLKLKLQREALTHNTHSSTSIEGNTLSMLEVNALADKRDITAEARQKIEVLNYFKVLNRIIGNKQKNISEKRMLVLHKLLTENLLSDEKSGIYKKKSNFVVNEKNIVIFRPPGPKEAPGLIKDLIQWVNSNNDVHPIIKSAIFHHQFVTIHPFIDGNGRLARAISQWILYYYNFDPWHFLAYDDYYAKDRKKYYQKIQQARDLDYDLTYWLEYIAEGILSTLEALYRRIQRLAPQSKQKVHLTPKQVEVIELIQTLGKASSYELMKELKINRARVNQLVSPLLKTKIIKKEGQARATKYLMN